MSKFKALAIAILVSSPAFASEEKGAWASHSSPAIASKNFIYHFEKLPLSGKHEIPGTGWSDDYWPTQKGSINRRWNAPGEPGFNLRSPGLAEARAMSERELAQLAPTEKYDLLRSRYDFPLVKRVNANANPLAKDWAGICNGWAPASLNLAEPRPVVMTNAEGLKIPFGSSDVKALLSFYYAYHVEAPTNQIGLRCFLGSGLRILGRGCGDDLNAGAFHVVLTNKLGLERRGFLADVDRLKEVWNQPITSFESEIVLTRAPRSGAARNAVREVLVRTKMYYGSEIDPQWEPVLSTELQLYEHREYEYTVELDAQGNVVGGEWLSWERPDFIWFRGKAPFTGEFTMLEKLYEASIRN